MLAITSIVCAVGMMSLGEITNAALATSTADKPKPEKPRTRPAKNAQAARIQKCSGAVAKLMGERYPKVAPT